MTDLDYTQDERREEADAYQPVSEATRAIALWLRQKPMKIQPRLNEMDKAVVRGGK